MPLEEMRSAIDEIRGAVAPKAEVSLGVALEEQYGERVQIILLATGVGGHALETVLGERRYANNKSRPPVQNYEKDRNLRPGDAHGSSDLSEAYDVDLTDTKRSDVEPFPHHVSPFNLDTPAFLRRQRISDSVERNQF